MKKQLLTIGLAAGLISSASAVPSLQLDINGGTYDATTQTIVATGGSIEVIALVDTSANASTTFYLSMAIVPKQSQTPSAFGSFTAGGNTYSESQNMQYGIPPVADPDSNPAGNIGPHDIFQTWYGELSFSTLEGTAASYNTQDNPGGLVDDPNGALSYHKITIDLTGLTSGYAVHFDLYTVGSDDRISDFAPFSHDAQGFPGDDDDDDDDGGTGVPDAGASLMLLGLALVGVESVRRRLK